MTELFVLACVGDRRVAVPASGIDSIVDIESVVAVPLTPQHVLGLAAVRSRIVTVVDVAAALNENPIEPCGRAIVIVVDGHRYALRLASVDDIAHLQAVLPIERSQVRSSWRHATTGVVEVDGGFALLLDPAKLIRPYAASQPLAA